MKPATLGALDAQLELAAEQLAILLGEPNHFEAVPHKLKHVFTLGEIATAVYVALRHIEKAQALVKNEN